MRTIYIYNAFDKIQLNTAINNGSMSQQKGFRDSIRSTKHERTSPGISMEDGKAESSFCVVPGRLSLLSSTCKYRVTVDEIRRRLSAPECLNASLLGGILRRAKSKNGGRQLRERLQSIGVSLPPGRRKASTVTLLTALVEGEALHLAKDFNGVCSNDFPRKACAKFLVENTFKNEQKEKLKNEINVCRSIAEKFVELLEKDKPPVNGQAPEPILNENTQRELTKFSMLTHGFGSPAIVTSINVFISVLKEIEYNLNKPIIVTKHEQTIPNVDEEQCKNSIDD